MNSIALDCQDRVKDAARPVRPGDSIGRQLLRAARALGYKDGDWRIRAAWYGHAGCWSGVAIDELRERHRKWQEKQKREADAEQLKLKSLITALANRAGIENEALDAEDVVTLRRLADQLSNKA